MNSAYAQAGATAAHPALAEAPNSPAAPHISSQQLLPGTLSQKFPKSGAAQGSPCCSELSIWSCCQLQHKKVTAEADGLHWIWVERGVVWATLGKRLNVMGEATDS